MWLALIGICLLGLALRLYCLDCHGLWYDELASVEAAQRGLSAIFTDRFGWLHTQTPLHYLIVWLTTLPLDPALSAVPVRLPSALAGALTIPVVFALGTQLFHPVSTSTTQPAQTAGAREKARWVGLVGAGLVGLSAVHLNYSQDARPYALLTLLTTLSVYCLLRAERAGFGGHGHANRWWLGFGVVCALNLLNAYIALTLVMPAVLPYLLWMLYSLFARHGLYRRHRPHHRQEDVDRNGNGNGNRSGHASRGKVVGNVLLHAVLVVVLVGLVSTVVFLDMSMVPRTPPDMGAFRVGWLVSSPVELVSWFTRLGAGGQVERAVQMALLLLAIWGVYGAVRAGAGRGALLCALLIVVPSALLAVLSTSNVVYQRYALFALPFYFLLVANGLVSIVLSVFASTAASGAGVQGYGPPWVRWGRLICAVGLVGLVVLPFAVGAHAYVDPARKSQVIVRGSLHLRDLALYLARHAGPQDAIIFAGWDPTVSMFYWRDRPPAPAFSVVDPRIFDYEPAGHVYWVFSYEFSLPQDVLGSGRWQEVARFGDVLILRQNASSAPAGDTLDWFAHAMLAAYPGHRYVEQVMNTLLGGVYQARGELDRAAHAYRKAGTLFPIGEEYLRTSQGWAERGYLHKAWRDALIAKSMQPYNPELHTWMGQLLSLMGESTLSHVELQLGEVLAGGSPAPNSSTSNTSYPSKGDK
jgi:hypothetical protein